MILLFWDFCINRIKTFTGVYKKCRACISCKSPCTDLSMLIGLQVDDISCFVRQCQPLHPARGHHLLYRLHDNWKAGKQLPALNAKQVLYRQFWKEDFSVLDPISQNMRFLSAMLVSLHSTPVLSHAFSMQLIWCRLFGLVQFAVPDYTLWHNH